MQEPHSDEPLALKHVFAGLGAGGLMWLCHLPILAIIFGVMSLITFGMVMAGGKNK